MAYAWARILVSPGKTINVGDEVSEGDLPEGDYQQFVEEGVIKDAPLPEGILPTESPRTAIIREATRRLEEVTGPSGNMTVSRSGSTLVAPDVIETDTTEEQPPTEEPPSWARR